MDEQWRTICDGLEISSEGRVRAWDKIHGWRGPFVPQNVMGSGYFAVCHNGKPYYLAREVAKAFIGPPPYEGATIDHANHDRTDNRLKNLQWATRSEQRINQSDRMNSNAREPDKNQNNLGDEKWAQVGRHAYSTMGRARVMKSHGSVLGPIFTPKPSRMNKYAQIGRGKIFHRQVALAFLGPPPFPGATVDHKNQVKTDNRLSNLRWASKSMQNKNKPRKVASACLSKKVDVFDDKLDKWVTFPSFSEAARNLQQQHGKQFQAAGVGLAAKRLGSYHGVCLRLAVS
tara:strand:- start:228 stop:1088 length:861 start_codon:yes stop_codon:yes gene_type:complete